MFPWILAYGVLYAIISLLGIFDTWRTHRVSFVTLCEIVASGIALAGIFFFAFGASHELRAQWKIWFWVFVVAECVAQRSDFKSLALELGNDPDKKHLYRLVAFIMVLLMLPGLWMNLRLAYP